MNRTAESFLALRWKCPFCRKSWSSKARANEHVKTCWLDPANQTCKTCTHHVPAEAGGCTERGGCQCQDIEEHCLVGVDMTRTDFVWTRAGDPPEERTVTVVQVNCEKWEAVW